MSRAQLIGRSLSGLTIGLLLLDSYGKLAEVPQVLDGTARLGYPARLAVVIGVIELGCVLVHLFPRTSVLGAVLLTGYFGGAVASHFRIGDPLLSNVMAPIYMATIMWTALLLRDAQLRAFVGLRSRHVS